MAYSALVNRDWGFDSYNSKYRFTELHIIIAKIFLPSGILFVDIPGDRDTRIVMGYDDAKLLIRNCNGIKTLIIQYLMYNDNYERVVREYTVVGDFAVVSLKPIEIEGCEKSDKNDL